MFSMVRKFEPFAPATQTVNPYISRYRTIKTGSMPMLRSTEPADRRVAGCGGAAAPAGTDVIVPLATRTGARIAAYAAGLEACVA